MEKLEFNVAYYTINRKKLIEIMQKLGILRYLIKLTNTTMDNVEYV